MALNIKSDEADAPARELADLTGETLTQAVVAALRERLERSRTRVEDEDLVEEVRALAGRYSGLPIFDARAPDEIVGYDGYGVPR